MSDHMAYFLVHSFAQSNIASQMIKTIIYNLDIRTVIKLVPMSDHMAYFLVHSFAQSLYFPTSVLYSLAISGTSGSSGLGSHRSEQIDSSTLDTVSAGDHCDLRMSKHIAPLELMLG